jgi:hypothetical protein
MEARPLAVSLSIGTAVVWCAFAVVAPRLAVRPLLGFIPISAWDTFLHGAAFQFLLPIAIFLCLPVAAWTMRSRKLAWFIPVAPIAGVVLFYVQFAFGMAAFT